MKTVVLWFLGSLASLVASLNAQPTTGTVRLMFTEHGRFEMTAVVGTVYFELPGGGHRERRVTTFKEPLVMDSMPAGTHRLTVVAQTMTSALVSSEVHEVMVTAGVTSDVRVNLVRRVGSIHVRDATGRSIGGAHFYSSPSAVNSTADDDGVISLATLAVGTALTVRTIQWGMTCHRVTASTRQTVVVPDATEELVIVTPTMPTSHLPQRRGLVPSAFLMGAMVSGLPGADCAIPYEHFPVTLARAGTMTAHTMLLPPGEYRIRLRDGRTLAVRAPGRVELFGARGL